MAPRAVLLVVDELPIFRELASIALAPLGRVVCEADAQRAADRLRRDPPALVLAQYPPPHPTDPSLCDVLKSDPLLSRVPIVLVTSGDDPEAHARAVRTGADDVLTKPLDRPTLLAAVRRLLDAPVAKGLPRVPVETPVRLAHELGESWGVARNLSRGGIFVETEHIAEPRTELRVEFPLPGRRKVLSPTARVVWVRVGGDREPGGIGLRFLALDGESARSLEEFVHEHRGAPRAAAYAEGASR